MHEYANACGKRKDAETYRTIGAHACMHFVVRTTYVDQGPGQSTCSAQWHLRDCGQTAVTVRII